MVVVVVGRTDHNHGLGIGCGDRNCTEADNSNSGAQGNGENSVTHGSYLKRHPFPKGDG